MSYSNETKPATQNTYLLMEDGFYLLQEDGSKIVLTYGIDYTNTTKPANTYTNTTKPS